LFVKFWSQFFDIPLFRRLEKAVTAQVKCNGAIGFIRLCQIFDSTPTFVKIDEDKAVYFLVYAKNFKLFGSAPAHLLKGCQVLEFLKEIIDFPKNILKIL